MWAETMTEHPLTLNTPDGHTIVGRQYLNTLIAIKSWLAGSELTTFLSSPITTGVMAPTARLNTRGIMQTRTDGNGWWAIWRKW